MASAARLVRLALLRRQTSEDTAKEEQVTMHAQLPAVPLDIVGDVHGELDALCALLAALGYDEHGRHGQGRHLVFVGDLCDRGPDSPGVVARVREMVTAGRAMALLGNHELCVLRGQRISGNDWFWGERRRHDGCFAPYASLQRQAQRDEVLAFFGSLPLTASRPDLRVVHAAWHGPSVEQAMAAARVGRPVVRWFAELDAATDKALDAMSSTATGHREEARRMGNPLRVLTAGIERCAPAPYFANGQWRFTERVRWWDSYEDDIPVVMGHYWRGLLPLDRVRFGKGGPDMFKGRSPMAWLGPRGNVFCIDFSVGGRWQERLDGCPGAGTRLAALRWPERELVLDSGESLATTGFGQLGQC